MKEWGSLIFRALILGIGLTALNDLVNDLMDDDDDELYANLNMRDKENYYLFRVSDNFVKLPKGRVLSVFGGIYLRGKELGKGNKNAFDGYLESFTSAVTPVENLSRTIFSPFSDVATNTSWYGTEIESARFKNVAPKERYDESTSAIAKFLGNTFNYSPKKIHYLIDQYSGVIGDIILPATTPKAERGILSGNFTVDPTLSNKLSNDFYTMLDEANYAKTDNDPVAALKVRYLNSISGEVSDMYKQKQDISNSDKSDKDKLAESKTVQVIINSTFKAAVKSADELEKALQKYNLANQINGLSHNKQYAAMDETLRKKVVSFVADYYYTQALIDIGVGAELSEKQAAVKEIPMNDLAVYLTAIGEIEAEKDRNGNSIINSRENKVFKYIESQRLTKRQKELLFEVAGYKVK